MWMSDARASSALVINSAPMRLRSGVGSFTEMAGLTSVDKAARGPGKGLECYHAGTFKTTANMCCTRVFCHFRLACAEAHFARKLSPMNDVFTPVAACGRGSAI